MSVRKAVVSAVLLIVTPLLILNLYPCIMPHVYTKQRPHVCTELSAIADFGNSSEFIVLKQTNVKHPAFIPSGPFSKDLIVHSVHFDDRARNGHDNVTMFFVGVNKTIFDLNWIVGCGTGNKKASNFTIRFIFTTEDILLHNWLEQRVRLFLHVCTVQSGFIVFISFRYFMYSLHIFSNFHVLFTSSILHEHT